MDWQNITYKIVFLALTTFFSLEIIPIKINPISWFCKRISLNINTERDAKIKELNDKLIEIDKVLALMRRANIIRFADEVRHRVAPESQFLLIFDDIKAYNKYCAEHEEFPNNVIANEIDEINKKYKEFFKRTVK